MFAHISTTAEADVVKKCTELPSRSHSKGACTGDRPTLPRGTRHFDVRRFITRRATSLEHGVTSSHFVARGHISAARAAQFL
mmetsp:Transcript_40746/g.88256  ORF Transcript_40746/g.88256 Transcript_40746/m.88256 type:complete len:82 (+) Transcript_40746:536-781(+)